MFKVQMRVQSSGKEPAAWRFISVKSFECSYGDAARWLIDIKAAKRHHL